MHEWLALQPVCETVIKRTASELSLGEAPARRWRSMMARSVPMDARRALREAEIELIDGSPGGLFDIAHVLFPDGGLRFSRLSESARGYLLAEEGRIEPPLAPKERMSGCARSGLRPPSRRRATSFASASIRSPRTWSPCKSWTIRKGRISCGWRSADCEAPSPFFSPVLQSPELERLGQEARWLGQEVGRLRDLDVVANDIVRREAALHPDEPGLRPSRMPSHERRRSGADSSAHCLAGRSGAGVSDRSRAVRGNARLAHVAAISARPERLAAPVSDLADSALSKRWKKVGKRRTRTRDPECGSTARAA